MSRAVIERAPAAFGRGGSAGLPAGVTADVADRVSRGPAGRGRPPARGRRHVLAAGRVAALRGGRIARVTTRRSVAPRRRQVA